MPDLGETLIAAASGGTGVALGVAALKFAQALLARRRTPEQKMGDAAGAASELIKLALEASGTSVQQMLERQEALGARLQELESSHAACESRCESLTGELRQANQRLDSLMRQLREPGATSPGGPLAGVVFELADGGVTTVAGTDTKAGRGGR